VTVRIADAVLVVADQDVMIRFFVDRLGWTLDTDAEMWPGARWVRVSPPGAPTGLVLSGAKDFQRDPDAQYPMVFAADDLDAEAAALRTAGLEVTDPVTEGWGTYVRVTDPEGRQLMISRRA
jgi:predicted enzyme related to lactoylglutathione lyase